MKEMKVKKKEEKETCSYKAFAVHRRCRMCIVGWSKEKPTQFIFFDIFEEEKSNLRFDLFP